MQFLLAPLGLGLAVLPKPGAPCAGWVGLRGTRRLVLQIAQRYVSAPPEITLVPRRASHDRALPRSRAPRASPTGRSRRIGGSAPAPRSPTARMRTTGMHRDSVPQRVAGPPHRRRTPHATHTSTTPHSSTSPRRMRPCPRRRLHFRLCRTDALTAATASPSFAT